MQLSVAFGRMKKLDKPSAECYHQGNETDGGSIIEKR